MREWAASFTSGGDPEGRAAKLDEEGSYGLG